MDKTTAVTVAPTMLINPAGLTLDQLKRLMFVERRICDINNNWNVTLREALDLRANLGTFAGGEPVGDGLDLSTATREDVVLSIANYLLAHLP